MKHLLFLSHCVPFPPDKGDRTRAFHELAALSGAFRVTAAFPLRHGQSAPKDESLRPWASNVVCAPADSAGLLRGAVSLLAGRSVTEAVFHSRRLLTALIDLARRDPFDAVLAYSSNILPMAMDVPAPVHLVDLVDADSAKWTQYAQRSHGPLRWLYAAESRAVGRLERRAVQQCQGVFIISPAEAAALPLAGEKALPVGNGVDQEFFRPWREGDAKIPPSADGAAGLVFVGQMDYPPNVDAVCWFAREVWPALRKRWGGLTLTIVGRHPAKRVRELANRDGITVTGEVDDVRPYVWGAAAVIAPLQIVRGVPNKVLESMSMGQCVIASPQALVGLEVTAGADVLCASTPAEWEQTVAMALEMDDVRRRLAQAARQCVQQRYTWDRRMAALVERCLSLCSS